MVVGRAMGNLHSQDSPRPKARVATLKVNGSTLIVEEMWKKSLIHSNINVEFKILACVLIIYGKYKM
jgi:hypothetical protein